MNRTLLVTCGLLFGFSSTISLVNSLGQSSQTPMVCYRGFASSHTRNAKKGSRRSEDDKKLSCNDSPRVTGMETSGLNLNGNGDKQTRAPLLENALEPSVAIKPGYEQVIVQTTVGRVGAEVPIFEIQGRGHISPLIGEEIETSGIVTAIASHGFYLQDPVGDAKDETSDAIFIFVRSGRLAAEGDIDRVAIGDEVHVAGVVSEWIPGGAATGNLSITQITDITSLSIKQREVPCPAPQVVGSAGRIPPAIDVISVDEIGSPIDLQSARDDLANRFDPKEDGIDFFESLEGMLVRVENAVAISATHTHSSISSEFYVLANRGDDISPADARTARGGILLQPDPDNQGDQNPERIKIKFAGPPLFDNETKLPLVKVGDQIDVIVGVVGYSFGNFEVLATDELRVDPSDLEKETTSLVGDEQHVTIASYNVLNLSPLDQAVNQRATLAKHIVHHLSAPDVIALQEVQDNNGALAGQRSGNASHDGIAPADQTLQTLIDSISAAGGPLYAMLDIPPVDGSTGGIPGGNIRNAYLFNPNRIQLLDSELLTRDVLQNEGVSDPGAFDGSRSPLLARFRFRGTAFIVINNHLTSRFGSTPVFGSRQPFVQAGKEKRRSQVQVLNKVVRNIMDEFDRARVIVLGDLNTFEFTHELTDLLPGVRDGERPILTNLIQRVDDNNVYTYVFEGNSQVLDHMFVTPELLKHAEFDIVHVNVDFPAVDDRMGSDHDPIIARFRFASDTDDP